MGSVVLFICSRCCVLYSAGSGAKGVNVIWSGLRRRLFVCIHVCMSCRYVFIFVFQMFMSLDLDVMAMSSAYVVSLLVLLVLECRMCLC